MKNIKVLFKELGYLVLIEWSYFIEKYKTIFWNRGIRMIWARAYIRKNEFHSSLNIDFAAAYSMDPEKRERYIMGIIRRRQIAHENDPDFKRI